MIFESDKNRKHFVTNVVAYLRSKEIRKILSTRICPCCNEEVIYDNQHNRKLFEGKKCKKCCNKEMSEQNSKNIGEKNNFFGKHHTKESMDQMVKTKETSESWKEYLDYKRSDEHKKEMSEKFSGENNPRFGLGSLKDIWIREMGKENGMKRWKEWVYLQIKVTPRGEESHMFGKPSPVGSGNGWSGWYKDWYFRSLCELSYLITEIEGKNLSWENGEIKKYKIPYTDWDGSSRNYFPDFVVENKYMIECKPLAFQKTASVLCKKTAAEKFCAENNMEYIILEPETLSMEIIKELYVSKKIKFIPRYEEKFIKKYFD